ncbi:uncharacterized protein LOC143701134 [Siphateles boraxobius]|uniref:uncharacterized protein LOC143701134 n=1 Tax=Siphateles boraxobius TaxID=180520 RepID=UPI00406319E2
MKPQEQLSAEGPQEIFANYVEWVLASRGSTLTAGPADDDTSPNPVPSQIPSHCEELQHEPTVDEYFSAAMFQPAPTEATEQNITPELLESDQVREPPAPSIAVGVLVEYEGMEANPAHRSAIERVPF